MLGNEKIILDFAGTDSVGAVHERLKAAFGFPAYYGANWDALCDCLEELLTDGRRYVIELHGFYSMDEQLWIRCAPMLKVFEDIAGEDGNMEFMIVS